MVARQAVESRALFGEVHRLARPNMALRSRGRRSRSHLPAKCRRE